MVTSLTNYKSIQTNLFIKIEISPSLIWTFSDYHKSISLTSGSTSTNYTGLGQLLSVTKTTDNLRATPGEVTLAVTGILNSNISTILNNRIKGSSIVINRGIFDPNTAELISNYGKFQGIITNFDISDDLVMGQLTGSITLTLVATSVVDVLNNKVTGRRTNPVDQKIFYPTDNSMDRIPGLVGSNFNFGAPN